MPPLLKGGVPEGGGGIPASKPAQNRESAPEKPQKSKRGVRQGDLSATMPAEPAAPSADFVRPNPLDGDIIMDATARLLAPRSTRLYAASGKPSAPPPRREEPKPEEAPAGGGKKRRRHRKKGSAAQPGPGREAPMPPLLKGGGPERSEGGGIPDTRELPKPKKASGAPVPAPKGRGKGRGGRPAQPPRQDRQKDSTELAGSVMKPYYLSDD